MTPILTLDCTLSTQDVHDDLNYSDSAKHIREIIVNSNDILTFGLFGPWGSGKTTLLNLIISGITNCIIVRFSAWRYESDTGILFPLMAEIDASATKSCLSSAKLRDLAFQVSTHGKIIAETTARVLVDLITDDLGTKINNVGEAVEAKRLSKYQRWLDETKSLHEEFERFVGAIIERNSHLVVCIDDLDRCHPPRMVELLDSIKHFLSVPGCTFIIAADPDMIEEGIRARYPTLSKKRCREYLDKIIQHSFFVPTPPIDTITNFLCHLYNPFIPEIDANILSTILFDTRTFNPRKLIRCRNHYAILRDQIHDDHQILFKLIHLREFWDDAFGDFVALGKSEWEQLGDFARATLCHPTKTNESPEGLIYRNAPGVLRSLFDKHKDNISLMKFLGTPPLLTGSKNFHDHLRLFLSFTFNNPTGI